MDYFKKLKFIAFDLYGEGEVSEEEIEVPIKIEEQNLEQPNPVVATKPVV